jgi:hypothetical protein
MMASAATLASSTLCCCVVVPHICDGLWWWEWHGGDVLVGNGVVLLVTTSSSTPAGRRLRLQPGVTYADVMVLVLLMPAFSASTMAGTRFKGKLWSSLALSCTMICRWSGIRQMCPG